MNEGDNDNYEHLTEKFKMRLKKRECIFNIIRDSPQDPSPVKRFQHFKGNSLKKICSRILEEYFKYSAFEIKLNDFSVQFNIERRRVYDVINIFEGLDIVQKVSKNIYKWQTIKLFMEKLRILDATTSSEAAKTILFSFESRKPTSKKKMLSFLTARIMKLFYAKEDRCVTFEEIMNESEKHYKDIQSILTENVKLTLDSKNRLRRLYDVINAFKAMGLISKIKTPSGQKMYLWLGEIGFSSIFWEKRHGQVSTATTIIDDSELKRESHVYTKKICSAFTFCDQYKSRKTFKDEDIKKLFHNIEPRRSFHFY